jgi:phenylacetic acid degradation operon negative regulatory protein
VAPTAIDLFAAADDRIYRGRPDPWDGHWTLVVLDGAESTPERRATLRQELAATGLGVVAPNVLASPTVSPSIVAETVARVGGFEQVLAMRSTVVPGAGLADPVALARRCVDLDALEQRYAALAERFRAFDDETLESLDEARATKLRLLVVSTFRRVVLADPMLPPELLPTDWAGDRARREAARVYGAVLGRSDRTLAALLDHLVTTPPSRFRPR